MVRHHEERLSLSIQKTLSTMPAPVRAQYIPVLKISNKSLPSASSLSHGSRPNYVLSWGKSLFLRVKEGNFLRPSLTIFLKAHGLCNHQHPQIFQLPSPLSRALPNYFPELSSSSQGCSGGLPLLVLSDTKVTWDLSRLSQASCSRGHEAQEARMGSRELLPTV